MQQKMDSFKRIIVREYFEKRFFYYTQKHYYFHRAYELLENILKKAFFIIPYIFFLSASQLQLTFINILLEKMQIQTTILRYLEIMPCTLQKTLLFSLCI